MCRAHTCLLKQELLLFFLKKSTEIFFPPITEQLIDKLESDNFLGILEVFIRKCHKKQNCVIFI